MTEREAVGTLAEEAAKLLAVLHAWAGDGGTPGEPDARPNPEPNSEQAAASNPAECRWCPLCQLARAAKATSPEMREHLSQAAVSLALALKALLDDSSSAPRRETPLEKIDLSEE
jgi:hypothetical protein